MSEYGENYDMCVNDDQRQAYRIGWNDGKDNPNEQHPEHVGLLWREFYQFGFLDATSG